MRRFLVAFRSAVPEIALDAVGLGGGGAVAYGAWLCYAPAGFIVGGMLTMLGCWLLARAR